MSVSFRYFKSEKFDGNSKNMTTKDLRYNSEKIDKLLNSSFPLRPLRLYNNAKSITQYTAHCTTYELFHATASNITQPTDL